MQAHDDLHSHLGEKSKVGRMMKSLIRSADNIIDLPTTLAPLPDVLHRGLPAVTSLAMLSLVTSSALFLHLSYRLLVLGHRRQRNDAQNAHANQFIILIFNLVLADIQQSIAFVLNLQWLITDSITVGTSSCWAQVWFISTGDLASGVFTFTIAIHLLADIVFSYRPSRPRFLIIIALLWMFVYTAALIGIAMHPSDYYVRASAWCWINMTYINERLWLHYFWVIIAEFGTVLIYALLFLTLHKRRNHSTTASRAVKLIVVYPVIYVLCTLPLVKARLRTMANQNVAFEELCIAGAMITSNGWLDVLLYSLTRRALIFGPEEVLGDVTALETFGTSSNWRADFAFGTTTTIEALQREDANERQGAEGSTIRESMEKLFGRSRSVKTETVVEIQSEIMPPEAVHLRESWTMKHIKAKESEGELSECRTSFEMHPSQMGPEGGMPELREWKDDQDEEIGQSER